MNERSSLSGGTGRAAALALAAAMLVSGCALIRRSDQGIRQQQMGAVYYSDLGPDTIDISGYPPAQQRHYAVYAQSCSRCHTLARSINNPVVSREFWELYVTGMRRRSYYVPAPTISRDEAQAIVDFLDFDSRLRKIEHKREFDALTADLKRRFSALVKDPQP